MGHAFRRAPRARIELHYNAFPDPKPRTRACVREPWFHSTVSSTRRRHVCERAAFDGYVKRQPPSYAPRVNFSPEERPRGGGATDRITHFHPRCVPCAAPASGTRARPLGTASAFRRRDTRHRTGWWHQNLCVCAKTNKQKVRRRKIYLCIKCV